MTRTALKSCDVVAGEAFAFVVDIPGIPRPKGSLRGFTRGRRIVLTSDNRHLKEWARAAKWLVKLTWGSRLAWRGPIEVSIIARMPRPKRPKHPLPIVKPDLDKICRSCGDVLSGIVVVDDAQVVDWQATKRYVEPGEGPGVRVQVREVN